MTVIGDAFSKLATGYEKIVHGPTKFQLMLAVFDGEHYDIHPRLFKMVFLRQNGGDPRHYRYEFHAHIFGATWESGYWILEGVEGFRGMSGLVKSRSFIAKYDTEKKKGYIKFLD